ncbi:MAG: aromatic acid exporter family protein [Clostridiaceae bacterium]|nr:aromatic acid exporter family protein [Clostridiaceae bacterium]
MKTVSRYLGQRTLKTAIGAAIAIFISFSIGLSYGVNSGIIVILSVQSTKKKSRDLAIMRIGSTVLALTIGKLVFTLVGFSSIAFGVYLLFFIPIASRLKFHDGIVPCSVLVSHLLAAKSVTFAMLGNEMMQMLIGAGIGFILNFFMPNLEKQLTEDMRRIDELFHQVLHTMAESLRNKTPLQADSLFAELASTLKASQNSALADAENKMIPGRTQYMDVVEIRSLQYEIMHYMKRYFSRLSQTYEQTEMVAFLTDQVADHFNGPVVGDDVVKSFKEFRNSFKSMDLPASRTEFENRATLYEFLNDLEHFIDVEGIRA